MSRAVLIRLGAQCAALLVSGLCCAQGHAQEAVKIVTEELPPYNMTENGKITGLSTQVVEAVLREIGLQGSIQSMPWARAYDLAQNTENVLIYSIDRTPAREKLFKWVGVVAPNNWNLYALQTKNLRLGQLDEAKTHQIATVNQDAGELYLVSKGFVIGKNLQSSAKYELDYEKLKFGRVDLWVANDLNVAYLARQSGDDPAQVLAVAMAIPDLSSEGTYMAFGVKTSDAFVERFRRGLEAIKAKGTYEALRRKWL